MKKRIIIPILLAVLLLATGGTWNWSRNILEIENASGKLAQLITINVCGNNYHLKDLPCGNSRRITFEVIGDSGFQVDVSFDDGSKISDNFGYVTGGAGAYNNRAKVKINSVNIEGIQE